MAPDRNTQPGLLKLARRTFGSFGEIVCVSRLLKQGGLRTDAGQGALYRSLGVALA